MTKLNETSCTHYIKKKKKKKKEKKKKKKEEIKSAFSLAPCRNQDEMLGLKIQNSLHILYMYVCITVS